LFCFQNTVGVLSSFSTRSKGRDHLLGNTDIVSLYIAYRVLRVLKKEQSPVFYRLSFYLWLIVSVVG